MKEVYVHDNPSNLTFNSYLLVFVRSWYMPWEKNETPMEDSWLRVPAFRSPGPKGQDRYVCINSNLELISPIVIAEDEMLVLKAGKAKPRKLIPLGLIKATLAEAIDVSAWELENKKSWPYRLMFDNDLVKYRYSVKYGETNSPYMNVAPTNRTFNLVKRTALPRPCRSCGKGRVRARR